MKRSHFWPQSMKASTINRKLTLFSKSCRVSFVESFVGINLFSFEPLHSPIQMPAAAKNYSYPTSSNSCWLCAAATASLSQRSFSLLPACPFTHLKVTSWRRYIFRKRCHRSAFFFPSKFFFSQPKTHFFSTDRKSTRLNSSH